MVSDNLVDNCSFTFKAEDGGGRDPDGSVSAKFSNSSVLADVNVGVVGDINVDGCLCYGPVSGVTLGAMAKYNAGSSAVEDYNGAISYSDGDTTATLKSK